MATTQRSVVKAGLDYRPVRLDLGDGKVWHLAPTVSDERMIEIDAAEKMMKDNYIEGAAAMRDIVAKQITEEEDLAAFQETAYSGLEIAALVRAYVQAVAGFPTE